MSKYRVGAKVRFKNDLISGNGYGHLTYMNEMKNLCQGMPVLSIEISGSYVVQCRDGSTPFYIHPDMLKPPSVLARIFNWFRGAK